MPKLFAQKKNVSYSHRVYCESNTKDSEWAMLIFDGDQCSDQPIDFINSTDGNYTCATSEKYNVSARVDCTGKAEWGEWFVWGRIFARTN